MEGTAIFGLIIVIIGLVASAAQAQKKKAEAEVRRNNQPRPKSFLETLMTQVQEQNTPGGGNTYAPWNRSAPPPAKPAWQGYGDSLENKPLSNSYSQEGESLEQQPLEYGSISVKQPAAAPMKARLNGPAKPQPEHKALAQALKNVEAKAAVRKTFSPEELRNGIVMATVLGPRKGIGNFRAK